LVWSSQSSVLVASPFTGGVVELPALSYVRYCWLSGVPVGVAYFGIKYCVPGITVLGITAAYLMPKALQPLLIN
jgi:hypothetical protein